MSCNTGSRYVSLQHRILDTILESFYKDILVSDEFVFKVYLLPDYYVSTSAVFSGLRDSCQLTFSIWHFLKQWEMISLKLL